MTACTNNGGSRARRAVTAALVGVLSVGAAPMVALATNAAPASGDVQLQADDIEGFKNGTVHYKNGGKAGDTFVYTTNGSSLTPVAQGLEVDYVSYALSNKKDVTGISFSSTITGTETYGYYYAYVKVGTTGTVANNQVTYGEDGNTLRGTVESSKPSQPGTYAVVVFRSNGNGTIECVSKADTFSIVNAGFEGATLIEDGDPSDTTFAYTGKANGAKVGTVVADPNMGVAINGVALDYGTDFTFGAVTEVGSTHTLLSTDDLEAGKTYQVVVNGAGAYADLSTKLTFTYGQLDLTAASVVSVGATLTGVPDTDDLSSIVKSINDVSVAGSNLGNRISATLVSEPENGPKGTYTFRIQGNEYDDENGDYVDGDATVTVVYADNSVTFDFGNADCYTGVSAAGSYLYEVDLTDEKPSYFDPAEITATVNGTSQEVDELTFSVKNVQTGAAGTVDDLKGTPGEWAFTVSVNATIDGQVVAGSASGIVKNYNDITEASNVFVAYDGEYLSNGDTANDVYAAADLSDKLSVKVTKGGKDYVEGTDYTVTIEKRDASGKWATVDQIVDAGNYRVTIKGVSFSDTGVYNIVVAKRPVDWIVPTDAFASETVDPTAAVDEYYRFFYAFTGEEIAPTYSVIGNDGKTYEIPADELKVTYDKDELKNEGEYRVTGVDIDATNFVEASGGAYLTKPAGVGASAYSRIIVTSTGSFVDVPNDAWYAEAVATAKQQGYIVGMNGSNFFAPLQNISRADVVCVLYRMAGGTVANEGLSEEEKSYVSDFEDVDAHAYYAKAVAWARKMGIVNGYGTTFGVSRDITTEEFVTMLARYAAKMGTDTSVDADAVLATVADGDEVTGYAREAVAWAVEQGYVAKDGNLIDPQGNVYRARVVTIAVRYQPEQLHTIL